MYEKIRLKYVTDEDLKIGINSMPQKELKKIIAHKDDIKEKISYLKMKGMPQRAVNGLKK